MLRKFNNLLANKLDFILAWMLYLPRDLQLVCLAVLTSAMLTFVRIFCTDQKWLGRAEADRIRLNELMAEAKTQYKSALANAPDSATRKAAKKKYKDDRKRFKGTQTTIKMKASKYEIKPLLYSIIPVALLATWAFARVAYQPPKANQEIEVRMVVPPSSVGSIAYLVPQDNLETTGSWIQRVQLDKPHEPQGWWDKGAKKFRAGMRFTYNKLTSPFRYFNPDSTVGEAREPAFVPHGIAVWHIKSTVPADTIHKLTIHYDNQNFDTEFRAGGKYYADPVKKFDSPAVESIDLGMTETRLFGMVGSIDWIYLSPWIVAYLLVAIPFVSILKRTFKIY